MSILENKDDQIYEDYKVGILDDEAYKKNFKRIRQERAHFTDLIEKAQLDINGAALETSKSILQLATNPESLCKLATPQECRELLDDLLYNPALDGLTVRYDIFFLI